MTRTPQELKEYNRRWFKTPLGRYHQHKGKAQYRGIEFLLSFEEWWGLWEASGKWDQRGRRKDQYVMARFGDQGAYEPGNVKICLVSENVAESNRDMDYPRAHRSVVMKRWWATASKEKRASISRALSLNNGSHRPEVRAKQSESAKAAWARKRGEVVG